MEIPRFLLTAGASGSGKTLITCGILQALKNRGLTPASFKCGPDYIDPMFHTKVIGTKSRNLDTFFAGENTLKYLLERNSQNCDVAVMEGVMGYYDGVGGITFKASAYDLARTTKTPAVLIVNTKGMSLSILAYIKGFCQYREDSGIKGVILNQMSPMLYPRMKKKIEEELDLKVYGYVPRVEECTIESRHLGLVLPGEVENLREKLNHLAEVLEQTLDLDGLLNLARSAPVLEVNPPVLPVRDKEPSVRIGLARDEAFCFIYEDNLELLRDLGAELIEFSPIHDKELPENLNGLLLYGGYPELYGKALEENESMRRQIGRVIKEGMPVMAECGGFMYLHTYFQDMEGNDREGVGIIEGRAYKTPKLSRFGYLTLEKKDGRIFGQKVGTCPAHEFHYFDSTSCGEDFYGQKPESCRGWNCIHCTDSMIAGFPHFYYWGNPGLAAAYVDKCRNYREKRRRQQS